MENKIRNYIALALLLLSFNVSAQGKYQWIKINPDPILLANSRQPYSDNIRQIDLIFQLQEKGEALYYSSSNEFFKTGDGENGISSPSRISKNKVRSSARLSGGFGVKKSATNVNKIENIIKAPSHANSADKLNSALKIPLNSKALKAVKNTASFGPSAPEIREMAFNDIKKKNPEIEQKSIAKQQRGKNLMWAGLVLVVLGGIMGFVFGRSAFLIALAGVVFAGIGYFFRI